FRGRTPDVELRDLYSRCRAFILPGEEDFGIAPVEAMASGKAVIALGAGGVLETAPPEDQLGGILFDQPEEEPLEQAIARFERVESRISPRDLQASAARFSEAEFLSRMGQVLTRPSSTSRPYRSAQPVSYASGS